jgi:hypothetical protein
VAPAGVSDESLVLQAREVSPGCRWSPSDQFADGHLAQLAPQPEPSITKILAFVFDDFVQEVREPDLEVGDLRPLTFLTQAPNRLTQGADDGPALCANGCKQPLCVALFHYASFMPAGSRSIALAQERFLSKNLTLYLFNKIVPLELHAVKKKVAF